MANLAIRHQLLEILGRGPRTASELLRDLVISQATFSRLVGSMGSDVLKLGQTRATFYARPRAIRDKSYEFPVYRVGETGDIQRIGSLASIRPSQYYWYPHHGQAQIYRHLPWFIQDLRPDGFVGRAFAHRQHNDLQLPLRLQDWSEDDILMALARRGEDCMGNLIVGDESAERYAASTLEMRYLQASDRPVEYPRLAQMAIAGDPVGSSAGGEQPKFTSIIEDGDIHHVIVKFTPALDKPEGQRWADLLVCEHIALEIIREAGIAAAESQIFQFENRMFLEVRRFDRSGLLGRMPMNSLGVVDDEYFGRRDSWIAMADRLASERMLPPADAVALRWLSLFGNLIGNTDQHFGNITLIPIDLSLKRFILAPAYDVLPMLYRPREEGAPTPIFAPQASILSPNWRTALSFALKFWERVSEDNRISEAFRLICSANRTVLERLGKGPLLVS